MIVHKPTFLRAAAMTVATSLMHASFPEDARGNAAMFVEGEQLAKPAPENKFWWMGLYSLIPLSTIIGFGTFVVRDSKRGAIFNANLKLFDSPAFKNSGRSRRQSDSAFTVDAVASSDGHVRRFLDGGRDTHGLADDEHYFSITLHTQHSYRAYRRIVEDDVIGHYSLDLSEVPRNAASLIREAFLEVYPPRNRMEAA